MIYEVCTDSYDSAQKIAEYPVKRIELCSALSIGGLTPSLALQKKCSQINGIEINTMIRPREGNFNYSFSEIQIMSNDIKNASDVQMDGVVFGCLTENGNLDKKNTEFLFRIAKENGLEVTFHRAFDFLPNPIESLHFIMELGFDRILTSGGKPTAIQGIDLIKKLVKEADGKIQIMAGSGVNKNNAQLLAQAGVDDLHFTSHQSVNEIPFGMGVQYEFNPQKLIAIDHEFKD